MKEKDMRNFMKPLSPEDVSKEDLEFLTETISFPVEVMNRILYQLVVSPNHVLPIEDLRIKVYPLHTTGNDLDRAFSNAVKILKAWSLITLNGHFAQLDDGAFQLYEILSTKEDMESPYTAFIRRKQTQEQKSDQLLRYQVIVAEQQAELNPLIKSANESTVTTNENIRRTNVTMRWLVTVTALITLVSAGTSIWQFRYVVAKDKNTEGIERHLAKKDSTIQQLEIELFQKTKDTMSVRILSNNDTFFVKNLKR